MAYNMYHTQLSRAWTQVWGPCYGLSVHCTLVRCCISFLSCTVLPIALLVTQDICKKADDTAELWLGQG